ncbi:MAG: ABC transporter ATP-binding protein [Candidatus Bipolaricaulota bacterium]|nr:ABC transporter ATP-binding protein [Candidatus Bipolaricaulota bacterium]MDW8030630.1 ABC transporter ATP-binding protein [Candidatus Bipolaricaulota bacterium]
MDEVSIELREISKRFGQTLVVDRLTLQIYKGEFFSLLGPSGCGKTTTLRIIAGFERPDSGELFINGSRATHIPPQERDVNLVFQSYALFPHLTVEQNVAFGLEIQKLPRAQIRERVGKALELVRLSGLGARFPHQLSGGQQQRVALARALVTEPSVLLLDEPLGALDLKLRQEMQLELKRLQRELKITFLYVTHDQEEALQMSDRLAVMHQGRVLQVGTPPEIYERPATRFVADFIGESNLLEGHVVRTVGQRALVQIGSLQANVLSDIPLQPHQRVTLALRPERIHLCPPTESNGIWTGLVEALFYSGKETRYRVRVSPEVTLTVISSAVNGISVGERVGLTWDLQSLRPIPERLP